MKKTKNIMTKFPALLLIGTLFTAGCPAGKQFAVDMAACAVGNVPSALSGLVGSAANILLVGGPSYQDELSNLGKNAGISLGVDALNCLVVAAIDVITNPAKSATAKLKTSNTDETTAAVARGRAFLAVHASTAKAFKTQAKK